MTVSNEKNGEIGVTRGECEIMRKLTELDSLWKKHGKRLLLFNGDSLRLGGESNHYEIAFYSNIRGGGGDGGDNFD